MSNHYSCCPLVSRSSFSRGSCRQGRLFLFLTHLAPQETTTSQHKKLHFDISIRLCSFNCLLPFTFWVKNLEKLLQRFILVNLATTVVVSSPKQFSCNVVMKPVCRWQISSGESKFGPCCYKVLVCVISFVNTHLSLTFS